ncbi:MAG: hypothetical protein ABFS38_17140, partial [Bacteroidota bacterium]
AETAYEPDLRSGLFNEKSFFKGITKPDSGSLGHETVSELMIYLVTVAGSNLVSTTDLVFHLPVL